MLTPGSQTMPITLQTNQHTRQQCAFEQAQASGLAALGIARQYGRGVEIFGQGEPAERIFKVLSGAVRLSQFLKDGRRQICGFYFAGDMLGLTATDCYRFTAESIVATNLAVIGRRQMLNAVHRHGELGEEFCRSAVAELERAQRHFTLLGRKNAAERLITFLLAMSERFNGSHVVLLPMGRQDIADYLGLTIETVSRMMTQLEAAGLIALPRPREVVLKNIPALKKMEEQVEDDSDDLPAAYGMLSGSALH